MLSKQLLKLVFENNKIAINLPNYNANKLQVSSIFKRKYSKADSDIKSELDKPLKFTSSPANDWKAVHSRTGNKAEYGPWYEAHVINASLIIFMIYFFILREENDIDLLIEQSSKQNIFKKE